MSFIYYDPLFNRSTGSREIELTSVIADTATITNLYNTNMTSTNGIISSLKVDSIEKNTASSNLEIKNSGGDILFNTTNVQTKNIIPYANNTYDIGTALNKYRYLYLDTANITTGNITTLQNCTTGTITTLNATTGNITTISNCTTGTISTCNITTGNITTLNTGVIQNAGNISINATGGGSLSLDNDNDNSIINIGYYDGSSTTQGKTINIGDANDTTINIHGTNINVVNRLRVGNDATSITNDLQVQTTNNTSLIGNYCNKVGGGGRSSITNG